MTDPRQGVRQSAFEKILEARQKARSDPAGEVRHNIVPSLNFKLGFTINVFSTSLEDYRRFWDADLSLFRGRGSTVQRVENFPRNREQ